MSIENKCWVCLRITPEYVLKLAHKVWEDTEEARFYGLLASKIIEACYSEKPIFFCGRPKDSLLSGLFYCLIPKRIVKNDFGFFYRGIKYSQQDIADRLNVTSVTVRNNYKRWLKCFEKVRELNKFDESLRTCENVHGVFHK